MRNDVRWRALGKLPSVATAARVALVLVAVLLVPTVTRADVRTEARRHFRSGMALVAEGQVEEGVAELLRAYEILPHPNVLYNVGRAYAESGRYEQAVDYFQRYLASDPPDRAEVQGFLSAVEARIAAIAAAENATSEEPARVVEAPAPVVEAVPVASDEEIAALEDSATQIDALAEST